MKSIKKIFALGIVCFLLFTASCARTPQYSKRVVNGIASLESIMVNGDEQHLLLRGKDLNNPVVLFLHGGPGMPMMYMAHKFQKKLEEDFVVVQWDQRSSGKSYKKDQDSSKINIRQYMDDAQVIITHLKDRFKKEKIILAGHSWGSYLGTLLVNEDPDSFHAYIGIGQVVDDQKGLDIQKQFLEATAQKGNLEKDLAELKEHGVNVYEKYLFKYGGELKHHKSFMPFIWAGFGSPEYNWGDVFKVSKGSSFASKYMKYNVHDKSLLDKGPYEFSIPVFYFTGTHDYTTPYVLIEDYFEKVEAPHKEIVWFKESAHFPFFEEPEMFHKALLTVKSYLERSGAFELPMSRSN